MKIIFLLALLLPSIFLAAQADSLDLNRIEGAIKSDSKTVSEILTNKKYMSLHPVTAFRDLIKSYALAGRPLKIATSDEPGKKIRVIGTVKNESGSPVPGALIYLYQTDAKGWYAADAPHVLQNEGDMRHARLFGYVKSDQNGQFELNTVKPSGYPQSDLPAHIHVHISAEGYNSYVTEFLFDDDERLVGKIRQNSIQNRFLISKPEKVASPFDQQFSYAVTIKK